MAKNSVRDFDATAANNTDIQSVDIAENCAPSGINNAIRELMADIKDVSAGTVALESPQADSLTVTGDLTVDTNTLFVDASADAVGIGVTPEAWGSVFQPVLRVGLGGGVFGSSATNFRITSNVYYDSAYKYIANGGASQYEQDGGVHLWYTAPSGSANGALTLTERMRIDSSGNVGIGTTSPAISGTPAVTLQTKGTSSATTGLIISSSLDGASSVNLYSGNSSSDNPAIAFQNNLRFGTATDVGVGGFAERMRITSGGDVTTTGSSTFSRANAGFTARSGDSVSMTRINGTVLEVNRSNDGTLVNFFSAQVAEGTISVSGSTVSYNGGHLSRWSQLTDGTKDTSIVKGTVMTNLDQMAVWSHDAVAATYYVDGDELPEITPATYYTEDDTLPDGVSVGDVKTAAVYAQVGDEKTPAVDAFTEDNEQLNCMAVSSVEGDTNVAGVFVNWDNDDDQFNDMNVAMTGDMVIRIAQGTTVARGDLLMSAGDGTAKPQDDDIVRSKTIAKVTSTHVSHTYDDGSYLVPCVLMAC